MQTIFQRFLKACHINITTTNTYQALYIKNSFHNIIPAMSLHVSESSQNGIRTQECFC
jgi:hypothetical protein